MVDNERVARRALEIAEELRKALPRNTDFADGWQQRYLDRQNERFDRALEMAHAEVGPRLRFDVLQEIAQTFGLDYNAVCRCANAYLAGVQACRAVQRGASEWVCDCEKPGPNCKPTGWRAEVPRG